MKHEELSGRLVSRRGFLHIAGLAGAGATGIVILAGCGPFATPKRDNDRHLRRVGFLGLGTLATAFRVEVFLRGLGYDREHLTVEALSSGGDLDILKRQARTMSEMSLDVIVADSGPALDALQRNGVTSPIVAMLVLIGDDLATLTGSGVSDRLGENVTGLIGSEPGLWGKRLELLKMAAPEKTRVGVLWKSSVMGPFALWEGQEHAEALGLELIPIDVPNPDSLPAAFELGSKYAQALAWIGTSRISSNHALIARLAKTYRLPSISGYGPFAPAGGLMTHAADTSDWHERAALLVDRILKGEPAGEIPLERPTRYELTLNATTAAALEITFPESVLLQTARVIA